jgi:phosphopantothenoylcysteine decarboxylase/phosphopantothenate--cysteine ligase
MGYAVARAARRRGAVVTLVSGPTALATPGGCTVVHVETAAEMRTAMRDHVTASDVVVMVAAVADYRPVAQAERKIKKDSAALTVELEKTDDILAGLAAARGERILVGFAAETDDLIANALAKLERKNLDLIVANDVTAADSGFDVATNSATILDRNGTREDTGLLSKDDLADRILDRVIGLRAGTERTVARRG